MNQHQLILLIRLDYKLQDGDIVDLKTQKGKSPSKAWLKFVKTENAKSRIRSYFYKKEKDKSIETGDELLKEEIKKRRYNNSDLLNENVLNKLFSEIKVDTYDELCLGITSLKYTPTQIVNRLIDIFEPKKDDTIEKLLENKNIVKVMWIS